MPMAEQRWPHPKETIPFESVFITFAIDTKEGHDVALINIIGQNFTTYFGICRISQICCFFLECNSIHFIINWVVNVPLC